MSTRHVVAETLDNATIDPALTWTTGNVAEAFPGVFTTLGFTFTHEPMELAFRKMFVRLGVFAPDEVFVPDRVEDMFWTVFAGRAAANIDQFRRIADVTPGTSATAVEQQLFGYVRPETVDANSVRRYPWILLKAPWVVARLPQEHDAEFARLRRWRLTALADVDSLDEAGCLRLLADARQGFESIMIKHLVVAFVSSGLADRLAEKLAALGLPGLEAKLLSGVGSDENDVAHDLWALAHDEITLREFADRHGYHGTNEGQLAGVSWREDPTPVLARRDDYRGIAGTSPRAPRNRSREQERTRATALEQVESTVPLRRRIGLRQIVSLAGRWLALREQGKAGYLLTFDVARAAMRRLGSLLVVRGVLADFDDVFHLAYDDLCSGNVTDRGAAIAARRTEYQRRQGLRLPQAWTGLPDCTRAGGSNTTQPNGIVTGVAASGGVTEGRARVVRDPATTELDDGDILVCETTDPSWVSLFLVAGGVVTDHGGMLSHGPIVARELGIPCVCGTENGSYRIADGQWIRLDGDTGTVTIIGANTTNTGVPA